MTANGHIPVLLNEVVDALAPKSGDVIVDGTFGGGGYSRAILDAADCKLFGIDRDPAAKARAASIEEDFGDRFQLLQGCFGDMKALLEQAGVEKVDGIVLDIGVSSFQLDEADRGFSFMHDGPLDMRMSRAGLSAEDVVNTFEETELANIIYRYGEERASRRIAAAIVRAREEEPITRTRQLASVIEAAIGRPRPRPGKKQVHPATKTFQALRIYVNDELGELERALDAAENLLNEGGRLVVVSFHSLEDRIVKQFMAERGGRAGGGSRHMPTQEAQAPSFHLPKKSAVKPSKDEEQQNPRSRSSRLRSAVRTNAASWSGGV